MTNTAAKKYIRQRIWNAYCRKCYPSKDKNGTWYANVDGLHYTPKQSRYIAKILNVVEEKQLKRKQRRKKVTKEEMIKIFSEDSDSWEGDNVFKGLLIIAKYFNPEKDSIIVTSGREVITSVSIEDALKAGITEEDVIKLRDMNWMIAEDHLACFV